MIRREVQSRRQAMRHCYNQALRRVPDLSATVTTQFRFDRDGIPFDISAVGSGDTELDACVGEIVSAMRFPPTYSQYRQPDGQAATKAEGSLVNVRYPFHFRPTDKQPIERAELSRSAPIRLPVIPKKLSIDDF